MSDSETTSNGSNSNGSSDTADDNAGERDAASSQDREWLELGRQSVTVALVLMVLGEALMFTGVRWRHHLRTLGFLSTIVAFAVIFPAFYMLELTGGLGDDEDAAASNTPGANLETVTFVHTNASSDASVTWLGFELEADFSGYDLGLVAPENRSAVAESVPEPGSKDAGSFIAFESSFNVQLGKNLDSLLVLPFMWYLMPALPVGQSTKGFAGDEEE